MTPRQIEDYLQDMLDAISATQQFTTGMSFESFESDQKTIFAVTRAIEIIGEATKGIREHVTFANPCIALIPQPPFDKLRTGFCQYWEKGRKPLKFPLPILAEGFRVRA